MIGIIVEDFLFGKDEQDLVRLLQQRRRPGVLISESSTYHDRHTFGSKAQLNQGQAAILATFFVGMLENEDMALVQSDGLVGKAFTNAS